MLNKGLWSLGALVFVFALCSCSSGGGSGPGDDGEPVGADGDAGLQADGDGLAGDQEPDGGPVADEDLDGGDAIADQDGPDGGDATGTDDDILPVTCHENNDCENDQFCQKSAGDCVAAGTCETRPAACPGLEIPVCGCNLETYSNSCLAHQAGVNVFSLDACAAFQACRYDIECPQGFFCKIDYGCAEPGTCAVRPTACPDDWDPVCGCDQQEYGNSCLANLAGTNVSMPGGCGITNACVSDAECQEGFFCNQDYDCEGMGICTEIYPEGQCGPPGPLDHQVCGCDGQTYESYCLQMEAGTANWDMNSPCEGFVTPCTTQADCDPGEYCWTGVGACGASGLCRIIKDECGEMQIFNPVCGCDGKSYSNLCMAHRNAVNAADFGLCPITGCSVNADCQAGDYCQKEPEECNSRGQCQSMPTDCPPENEPVCGCDGQTYWNACNAASEGMNLAAAGACEDPCTPNQDCPEDEYCAWELYTCLSTGHCEPRPEISSCFDQPPEMVCACDGMTHENSCESASLGANVAFPGACGQNCSSDSQCQEDSYCAREIGRCYGPGQCQARPLTCPTEDAPVCGCNGQTFPNACYARAAGIGIVSEGDCQDTCTGNDDCQAGSYCQKIPGDCDGLGFCREVPPTCPDQDDPVCGCDGVTYPNECLAGLAGVSLYRHEECPDTCTSNADCTVFNEYCARPPGSCDVMGECLQKPQEYQCDFEAWEPVCACDGLSYQTACHANLQGQNISHDGKCDLTGPCMFNSDCDTGTFCKKEQGCRRPGTCSAIPADCPTPGAGEEVCSCELVTYPSACYAWMDSQSFTGQGPCGVTDGCYSSADCPADKYCWLVDCEGLGTCWDRYSAQECGTWNVDPVCGCDGVTYDNYCWATIAGYSVFSAQGACQDVATSCESNADCENTQFCFLPTGACQGQGVCHTRPDHCPAEYVKPVCGCNGATYLSYCEAHFSGVNVETLSDCAAP